MSYSTDKLTVVADCDLLIATASKAKADLSFKQLTEQRQKDIFGQHSVEIDADLQAIVAEISATQTTIDNLPDGPSREDAGKKKTKLEYRKFLLDDRRPNFGSPAYLAKELDLARVTLEMAEIDNFIAEVTARKTALS